MKRLLLPFSLALFAVLAGCKSEPANPLIGGWTSTTDPNATGAAGCSTHLTFTKETRINTWKGQNSTALVSYNVQPNEVFVIIDGGAVGMKFLTSDTTLIDSGYLDCTYKRD